MRQLLTVVLFLSFCSLASAELIITADDITSPFSNTVQTGSFEVYISNTGAVPQLSMFQTQLTISPASSGITFTGVEKTTAHPYVFSGSGNFFGSVSGSGSTVDVGDILIPGSLSLNNGVGLFKIDYSIAASTPAGTFNFVVSTNPSYTTLQDASSHNLTYSIHNGGITITPVPEPGMSMLIFSSIFGLLIHPSGRRLIRKVGMRRKLE
jgi:hypothetical protein